MLVFGFSSYGLGECMVVFGFSSYGLGEGMIVNHCGIGDGILTT